MKYRVVFSPEAEEQLVALYGYIADAASPDIAARYTEALVSYCESLRSFPLRGTARDDVRPGLRITNYKKRTVIAFEVDIHIEQVSIIGLFYGGQDYETILQATYEREYVHSAREKAEYEEWFKASVEAGLRDIEEGRVLSHEEVKARSLARRERLLAVGRNHA